MGLKYAPLFFMNIFSDYYKEICDRETIFLKVENQDVGFLVYEKLSDGNIFIQDCFIVKWMREKSYGSQMVQMVLNKNPNAKKIFSNVRLHYKTASESLIAQLIFGFKIYKIENDVIYLSKDVIHG